MKAELKAAMEAAEMDEAMVFGAAPGSCRMDWTDGLTKAALTAKTSADRSGHPMQQYKAKLACAAWMEANESAALAVCAKRKAQRDAYRAELARPKTAAEIDKMLGE